MIVIIFYGFFLFLFVIGLLWILIPAFYGPPSHPTHPDRIRRALKFANLQPDEILYDLGAGDGRVLLIAAQEFGAKPVGVEVGLVQCALIRLRIAASGLADKIQLKWEDYFKTDLTQADVVFLYATSREATRLAPLLEGQMKPDSRLISISVDFPEWEPSQFDNRDLIFIYVMPPQRGNLTTYLLKQDS